MYEYENCILTCPHCNAKIYVVTTLERGFSDHEDVHCPICKSFVSNIRADMGFEITKVEETK